MKLSRKFKEKLGFTLAEVMIVVAILAILTAVAAPNVAKYARSIRLRELNDSARAIYMAAEHKFTADVNKGVKLSESLELKSGDGLEPIADKRYKFEPSTNPDVKIPTMMGYVINRSGDNNKLVNIVESELEENNYIVEFNPETGDVYGVFYSNETDFKDDEYAYNNSTYNANSGVYYNAVHDGLKNDKLIGFYGNETIKPDEVGTPVDLQKPKVEIINKEKLVLKITAPTGADKYFVKADIDGKEIIPADGKCYISPNQTVEIILDSLSGDSTKPAMSGELQPKYETSIDTWLDETSGVFADCKDVTLTVSFYDENGVVRDQTVTKKFNPLFADGSSNSTVYVDYGRHLQNLEKANPANVIIRRTIDFDNPAGNYEGWQGTYGDKKFKALKLQDKTGLTISAPSGAEIQNIDIEGVIVYEDEDGDEDTIYSGLFTEFSGTAKQLVFRNPTISAGTASGVLAGVSMFCPKIKDIKVINPNIYGENQAGGLLGSDLQSTIENCAVYIEGDSSSWNDPTSDPYSSHTIVSDNSILSTAGGIIGSTVATTVKNSYAAVKIQGGSAGGLIGACIDLEGTQTTIENSFSAGHTYYGIYKGTAKKGTAVNLTDNVSGIDAGGLVSSFQGDLILKGTVFSSCSVSGNTVDPLYNISKREGVEYKAAFDPNTDTVYTLGTAYKTDGATVTEIKKSADTNVKTADQVMFTKEADFTVGKRYDMKVSSVFKYPVPGDMIMHGDWCNTEDITGFIYWEKEETDDYRIQALWYGNGKPEELKIPAANQLCKEQDGKNISDYGYAAFTIGGSLDNLVEFKDAGGNDIDDAIKSLDATSASPIVDGIRKILKESDELKDKISNVEDVKMNIYSGIDVGKGLVTATVSGHDYTFAPDFYTIYADQDGNHAGTIKDEYGIRTEQQLRNISASGNISNLDKNYKQSHDINLKDDTTGLTPIGDSTNKFTGTYNGGSYRIINAKINSTDTTENAGLFGVTDGAQLENIVMFVEAAAAENFVEIKGKNVGVIVGNAENAENAGKITNCVAAGYTVIGSENSGGIAGISACPITNCEANVSLSGDGNVGGIVGEATAKVDNCYALVHGYDGKADETLGGIAGAISEVTNCYVIFSGQISGYPVAKGIDNSTNYFASDDGYCSISSSYTEVGTGLHLYNAKAGDSTLSVEKKKLDSQISYTVDINKDETNKYDFAAVVKDYVSGKTAGKDVYVHYGPVPIEADTSGGYLSNGPLAGVFNFYYSYKWMSNSYDGLMVYNKFGKIYTSEYKGTPIASEQLNSEKPIGVFVLKAYDPSGSIMSPLDYGLRIEVNGITWSSFELMENASVTQGDGYLFYPRDSNDHIIDKLQDTTYPGHGRFTNPSQRFSFWKITGIEPENVNTIEIFYTPDGEKEGRILLTKREDDFDAIIPKAYVDDRIPPVVGAFYVHKQSAEGSGYYARAMLSNGAAIVPSISTWDFDNKLGIVVETSRLAYDLDYIVVYYDYTPYKLTQWDGATNMEDFEGYTLFLMDEIIFDESVGALPTNFNIEIGYGSKLIYFAKEGNGVPDASVYAPKEIRAKIGTVIYYKDNSGNLVAKAQMGDGKYIGDSTGEMQDLGFILSSDIPISDVTITIKDKNYQIVSAPSIVNQELFNGYSLYLLVDQNGAPIPEDFKLTINYRGATALTSSKF